MKKHFLLILICSLLLAPVKGQPNKRVQNFPKKTDYVTRIPKKENFWIFILAGQSNMAGRGFVEPPDTLSSDRIFSLNKENRWVYAKEPLHYNEPNMAGLDCGLSFGREFIKRLNDSIVIGLVPCAVGGSSADQWLGDSLHRGVKLLSNFREKAGFASKYGVIKGILWHQGEDNASKTKFKTYNSDITALFKEFRKIISNDSLPVFAGELGSFLDKKIYGTYPDSVNKVLNKISETDKNLIIIKTGDLKQKGDLVHFDSESQRLLGKRFAEKATNHIFK